MSVISKDEIQVGDTIRITREVEVTNVFTYGVQTKSGGVYAIGEEDKPVIELVDRPLPPLPTEPGSVVRVSDAVSKATWMLGVNDMWQSYMGVKKSAEHFHSLIKARGWNVEVIA